MSGTTTPNMPGEVRILRTNTCKLRSMYVHSIHVGWMIEANTEGADWRTTGGTLGWG